MLPMENKSVARCLAIAMIAITLGAAVSIPILLDAHKALDIPIIVAIVLLLFAVIPPELAVLRHCGEPREPRQSAPRTRHSVGR